MYADANENLHNRRIFICPQIIWISTEKHHENLLSLPTDQTLCNLCLRDEKVREYKITKFIYQSGFIGFKQRPVVIANVNCLNCDLVSYLRSKNFVLSLCGENVDCHFSLFKSFTGSRSDD
jgi:hypothetical protein